MSATTAAMGQEGGKNPGAQQTPPDRVEVQVERRDPSWAQDKRVLPFDTGRRVFAVGMRVDETALPPVVPRAGPEVTLPQQSRTRDRLKTYQKLPFGACLGWAPLSWDANDLRSQAYGLSKRLLRELPRPEPGFYVKFREFVQKWLDTHVKPVDVATFDEWLEGTLYTAARKAQLQEWHTRFHGQCPPRRYCKRIDSFIKRECYMEVKAPRWINSRHDAFKAWSGRYFAAIEREVFSLPYFAKHMTARERIQAIFGLETAGMRYYENDYKAFESHFVPELLNSCECLLYRHCLRNHPDVAERICSTITGRNHLRTRAGVKAVVEGTRMSGDMCTSLGNGFTNLMLLLFIVAEKGHDPASVRCLVEGDDGLFAVPCELTAADFARCGFTVEIAELSRPHLGHFCGATLSDDGVLLKDPHRVLSSFGWTDLVGCGDTVAMELLRAKALSLAHEAPDCPIVGALARAALARTDGYQPRWTDAWKAKQVGEVILGDFKPSATCRASFASRTGIAPATQLEVERLIQQDRMNEIGRLLQAPHDVGLFCSRYVEVAG